MAQEKSWQARISEATDAVAQTFVESISYDRRLYKQDIAGSIAHAGMLAAQGLITPSDRDAIEQGLRSIEKDIEAGNFVFDESMEDIHMVVEAALIARIGEPGRKLHTGRSRNDQVALDLRLWVGQSATQLSQQCADLIRALVELAERSVDVVMPSFTHLQRAQPISAAAEALAWAQAIWRARQRVQMLGLDLGNENPLGSGAIAGSSIPLDRDQTGQNLLKAQQVSLMPGAAQSWPATTSSIEATASRDGAVDLLYSCSMICQWLSRWAEQWIIYMTTEFGFIKIADRYTTSSSMMPQKRNPDMLELVRGRCGSVYGDLFALMTILKGLPIGYNRDLQEDKRIAFRALDMTSSCLIMATAIVASANYDKARIEPTLDAGFLDATSLAEYLVTCGIPFRTAHHIVGTLVAHCEKTGRSALGQLSLGEFNAVLKEHKIDIELTSDVHTCLGAANVVRRYQSSGAAGGSPLQQTLQLWKKRLNTL